MVKTPKSQIKEFGLNPKNYGKPLKGYNQEREVAGFVCLKH